MEATSFQLRPNPSRPILIGAVLSALGGCGSSTQPPLEWSFAGEEEYPSKFTVQIPGYAEAELVPEIKRSKLVMQIRKGGQISFLAATPKDKFSHEILEGVFGSIKKLKKSKSFSEGAKSFVTRPGTSMFSKDGHMAIIHDSTANTYFLAEIDLDEKDTLKPRQEDIVVSIARSAKVYD